MVGMEKNSLSKSVETSCVVRSEHRVAKQGSDSCCRRQRARKAKDGRKPEEEGAR
jgi:hypothetical protein